MSTSAAECLACKGPAVLRTVQAVGSYDDRMILQFDGEAWFGQEQSPVRLAVDV